jgi:hypothetical protein
MKVDIEYLKEVLTVTSSATGCEAAICGGYLRDLDYDIESKDLDVFIMVPPTRHSLGTLDLLQCAVDEDIEKIKAMKWDLDSHLVMYGLVATEGSTPDHRSAQWFGNSESGSNMREDVIGVKKYYCSDLDFVFMEVNEWEKVTENFDVSVCQIMCRLEKGRLNVYASDSYMAHRRGTGDIVRFYPITTSDNHIDRIKAKFGKVVGVHTTDATLKLVGQLTEEGIIYNDK